VYGGGGRNLKLWRLHHDQQVSHADSENRKEEDGLELFTHGLTRLPLQRRAHFEPVGNRVIAIQYQIGHHFG